MNGFVGQQLILNYILNLSIILPDISFGCIAIFKRVGCLIKLNATSVVISDPPQLCILVIGIPGTLKPAQL